jgi:hypothetical protein
MASSPEYTVHRVDPGAPESVVQPILDLNIDIHNAKSRKPDHHQTIEGWMNHLNREKSFILYATPGTSGEGQPVGFMIAHMKTEPEYKSHTLHLWIAGVVEAERKKGVFRRMMVEAEKIAKEFGVDTLGMATYPPKFPRLAEILKKLDGWVLESEAEDGSKVRYTKRV